VVVPVRIVDTLIGEPCEAVLAADGVVRCLPVGAPLRYRDSSCSQPIAAASACGAATGYVQRPVAGCGSGRAVHEIGDPVTGFLTYAGAPCALDLSTLGSSHFALGAELDPSEFVPLALVETPAGPGLVVRRWTGADGSQWIAGARDVARDVGCFAGDVDGIHVCTPSSIAVTGSSDTYSVGFADAACTEPALSTVACELPPFVTSFDLAACPSPPPVVRSTGDAATAYAANGSICDPLPASSLLYAHAGKVVPAAELPPVEIADEGTGPFRAREATASGDPIAWSSLVEAVDGLPCILDSALPGKCLPTPLFPVESAYFADDQCTVPLAPAPSGCYQNGLLYEADAAAACPVALALHEVGPLVTGDVWSIVVDVCTLVDPNLFFPGFLVQIGPDVPIDSFPDLPPVVPL